MMDMYLELQLGGHGRRRNSVKVTLGKAGEMWRREYHLRLVRWYGWVPKYHRDNTSLPGRSRLRHTLVNWLCLELWYLARDAW